MAVNYDKHNFVNGQVLSAEHLNSIEDAICKTCGQINENTKKAEQVQKEIENLKYLFLFKDGYFRNNINDTTQKLTLWDLLGYIPNSARLREFISRHNMYYVYVDEDNISGNIIPSEIVPLYIHIFYGTKIHISALIPGYKYKISGYKVFNTEDAMKSPITVAETLNTTASVNINKYIRQVTIGQFGGTSNTFDIAGQLQGGSWLFTDYALSSVTGDYTAMFGYNNTCFGNGNVCGGIKNNIIGRALLVAGENNLVEQCATGAIIGGKYGHANSADIVAVIGNGTSASNRRNLITIYNDGRIINSKNWYIDMSTQYDINGVKLRDDFDVHRGDRTGDVLDLFYDLTHSFASRNIYLNVDSHSNYEISGSTIKLTSLRYNDNLRLAVLSGITDNYSVNLKIQNINGNISISFLYREV